MIEPKEIFGNDYQEFGETDPFNPKNEVVGFISRKANEFYGALIINKVNGKKVPDQLIMGSPKMHYPFDERADGTRNYRFPSANTIEIYEKLDGTNILSYFYTDGEYRYLSYKTRLRPFLQAGKFGDFLSMWKEAGIPYEAEIKREMDRSDCNLSFELYGARNLHLIVYPNSLDIALLFGVTNTGRIIPPTQLKNPDIPIVNCLKVIDKDYVWNYEELQKELNSKLEQREEGYYSGIEGGVWYMHLPDSRCLQLKCKPEIIEAIHFSAGAGGLSRNVVISTCWNAFENVDVLTLDFIKQLLLEEFKPEVLDAKQYLIEECIVFVTREAEFRESVIEDYRKLNMNILIQKAEVMRALAQKYAKKDMRKVYSIISGYA
jgi:hypothetical protein